MPEEPAGGGPPESPPDGGQPRLPGPSPGLPGSAAGRRGLGLRADYQPPRARRAGRTRILIVVAVVAVFLAASGLLARWLSVENEERDDDLALIQAQARGDLGAMLSRLPGCAKSPSCVRAVREDARDPRLLRRGAIKILDLESPTAYSLSGASGRTRLAWTVIGELPVVQCIEVDRGGNFLTGITVTLVSLSTPINNEGDC